MRLLQSPFLRNVYSSTIYGSYFFSVGFRLPREIRNRRTAGSFPPYSRRLPADTRSPPLSSPRAAGRAAAAAPGRPNAAVRRGVSSKDGARPAPGLLDDDDAAVRTRCTTLLLLLLSRSCCFIRTCFIILLPFVGRRRLLARAPFVGGRRLPCRAHDTRDKVQLVHRRLRHLDTSQPHGRPSAAVGACLPAPRPTLRRIPPILSFPTRRMVPARYLPLFHYAVNNIRIRFNRFVFQTLTRSNRNLETHRLPDVVVPSLQRPNEPGGGGSKRSLSRRRVKRT